jgi:hypothetical protein
VYRAQQIEKAFFQYLVDKNDYPGDKNIPEGKDAAKPICRYGKTGNCVNIDELIPRYVACMPYDEAEEEPNFSGYKIYLTAGRGNVFSVYEELDVNAGGGCEPFPKAIAYWKLDETSGTVANDSSGSNHGEYVGDSTSSSDHASVEFAFDNPGSRAFDAGGERIDASAFAFPGQTFAITAWVRWMTSSVEPTIVAKASNTEMWWKLGIDSTTNRALFRLRDSEGSETLLTAGTVPMNEWVHLAATYNKANMCLYVDGKKAGCMNENGDLYTTGAPDIWIATSPVTAAPDSFFGFLDDIRIYSEPLSEGQIEVIATGGV